MYIYGAFALTIEDIESVLAAMAAEPKFWTYYPIYLENSSSESLPLLTAEPYDIG